MEKDEVEVPAKMTRFVVTMEEPVAFKPDVKSRLGPRVVMASTITSDVDQLDARKILLARREQVTPTRMQITLGDSLGDEEEEGANGLHDPVVELEEIDGDGKGEKKPDRDNIPR